MTKKEAFELLRKYDSQGQVSTLLIKKLQEKELSNIEEFLTNPLLVSLLFTAFEHKQAIPFKKYLFYRQVYDANFESHDLTKGDSYIHDKYSRLEIDDFHRVLRHLGFNCFKLQRIEFTKDELLKLIGNSRDFCVGLKFSDSDFLLDVLKTVPLFTQDGNYFRWSHKSLQEYFAAQFIYLDSKEKQSIILKKLYDHTNLEKFVNVLDLYYDMDYKSFRNVIEFSLLNEYDTHQKKSFIEIGNDISDFDLIRRKELTFLSDCYIFRATGELEGNLSDEKFGAMIREFEEQGNQGAKQFSGMIINSNHPTEHYYTLSWQSPKVSILFLLLRKRNRIVSAEKRYFFSANKSMSDFEIEDEYSLVKITDSVHSRLNSKKNFSVVNEILEATAFQSFTISHVNSLLQLEEIKKSIFQENESDFLLAGI